MLTIFKKHFPESNDATLKGLGMSKGGQIDGCNPIVPIDLQMGKLNWFSEVDNAGIFHPPRCKAILSRGSQANLVHLDRLCSPASANCTVSDGLTHPSCFPTCLTTMVLTLSLIWYTHSVMDSRQHALWQDREISLHYSQCQLFCAAADTPFIQGQLIQYAGHCTRPTWTISLNIPHKCRFPYTAHTIIRSPHKQLQYNRAEPNEQNIHSLDDVHSLEKGTAFYEKKVHPSDYCDNVVPLYIYFF